MKHTQGEKDAWVKNTCVRDVRIKVERKGGTDWTWERAYGKDAYDKGNDGVQSIKICTDHKGTGGRSGCAQHCSQDGTRECEHRFQQSSAARSCHPDVDVSVRDGKCRTRAGCDDAYQGVERFVPTSITADLDDVRLVSNCSGKLRAGSC